MRYRNTTYALLHGLQDLLATGQKLSVRGSEIRELRNRVIVVEQPRERCIILPARHNNLFASIAETMWVLTGRNDLAFLAHYLPRAGNFSDDGITWRAAYGPRLRNWHGVDQIQATLSLLNGDLHSRRAVMSIFDPSADFAESKDIPCNNWLHWLVRDNRLHLNVAIRSNDIMWGFSGINAFEWSVLHELMAFWLGVEVGEMTFFASSFHLYSKHNQRAQAIVERFPGITCYELGIASPRFQTAWTDFDAITQQWFSLEARSRTAPQALDEELARMPDPLLRHFLALIQLYNGHKQGWPLAQLDERLAALPETDLTAAAYEYFHRQQPLLPEHIPQPAIARYWARYAKQPGGLSADADTLRQAIMQLHAAKSAAYGPSWKRRGEQISITSNIARKVDRLERVAGGAPATQDETLFDTAIDLFVYCIKYQTYLADIDTGIAGRLFDRADANVQPPYSEGIEPVNYLVTQIDLGSVDTAETDAGTAAALVLHRFQELEACFIGGAEVAPVVTRLERAQQLTTASARLIDVLKRAAPSSYHQFLASCLSGSNP